VAVSVHAFGADAIVTAGVVLIFTVTPDDTIGTATHSTVDLAGQWARRLADGLNRAMPRPVPGGP